MQRARRYYHRAQTVDDPEAEAMLELLGQDIERLCPLLEKRVMVINTDWDDLNRYCHLLDNVLHKILDNYHRWYVVGLEV